MNTTIYKRLALPVLAAALSACHGGTSSAADSNNTTGQSRSAGHAMIAAAAADQCNGIPAWDAKTVYSTPNTLVVYNGAEYSNSWYVNAGEAAPGVEEFGAWKKVKDCSASPTPAPAPTPTPTPSPSDYPVYPSGRGSYVSGTIVAGENGLLYECKPAVSGWCNSTSAGFYAPGTGSAWADAWELWEKPQPTPDLKDYTIYPADRGTYTSGEIVVGNKGELYKCKTDAQLCNGNTASYAPGIGSEWTKAWELLTPAPAPKAGRIVVGYVDGTASGAFASIPTTAFAKYDVIIVGFSGCDAKHIHCAANTDEGLLSVFQKISASLSSVKPDAKILLSIGGEYGSDSFAVPAAGNMPILANSLITNIKYLNSKITTAVKISGVDIDIEVKNSEVNITPLAKALHDQGYIVSIAPQAAAIPASVNPSKPSNFILTAGGGALGNDYAPAVAAGYVNYVNLQAYNSGSGVIEINGSNEAKTDFHQNMAHVMNNLVSSNCGSLNNTSKLYANGNMVCIPATTKVVIGTVANKTAGGDATMWATEIHSAAGNAAILSAFTTSVKAAKEYPYYGGVMVWALGNDYMPAAFGDDIWDPVGAFTNNTPNFGF